VLDRGPLAEPEDRPACTTAGRRALDEVDDEAPPVIQDFGLPPMNQLQVAFEVASKPAATVGSMLP